MDYIAIQIAIVERNYDRGLITEKERDEAIDQIIKETQNV